MTALTGFGIFSWGGEERRSDRYGSFVLCNRNYDNDASVTARVDDLTPLVGKRVKATVRVVQTRKSGHIGDMFLGISPSTPKLGTEFVFIGILSLANAGWDNLTKIVFEPKDGRATFWLDPTVLYQLHDQTVEVTFEVTKDPFPPVYVPRSAEPERGVVGNGDNTYQTKNVDLDNLRLKPEFESHGDGLFVVRMPSGEKGSRPSFTDD